MSDHDRFISHLSVSYDAVWAAARWLSNLGYSVNISPSVVKDVGDDFIRGIDNGDLYISQRVEVKHRSLDFTGAHDWPFGDKIIVCAKHSFDLACPKPYLYLMLNRDKTHIAIIKSETSNFWTVEKVKDKRYENVKQECYFCHLKYVKFRKLEG